MRVSCYKWTISKVQALIDFDKQSHKHLTLDCERFCCKNRKNSIRKVKHLPVRTLDVTIARQRACVLSRCLQNSGVALWVFIDPCPLIVAVINSHRNTSNSLTSMQLQVFPISGNFKLIYVKSRRKMWIIFLGISFIWNLILFISAGLQNADDVTRLEDVTSSRLTFQCVSIFWSQIYSITAIETRSSSCTIPRIYKEKILFLKTARNVSVPIDAF